MNEPTPGPWEVRIWQNSLGVCNPNIKENYSSRIAECPFWTNGGGGSKQQPDRHTSIANAHILAAAPELLEALEKLNNVLDRDMCARIPLHVFAKVGNAIRKAKGEIS